MSAKGIAKSKKIESQLVNAVGFSKVVDEFWSKNPPPLLPSCLIASMKPIGPLAIVWVTPFRASWKVIVPANVCTAPSPVLESLADSLNNEYGPEVLATCRKSGCFPDLNTFRNVVGPKDLAAINGKYDSKSQYFQLTTRITLGTTEFTLYSLLVRGNGGKITPLLRSFGTP